MKKNYFLLVFLICSFFGYSQNSEMPYFSQRFQIDTSFVLEYYVQDFETQHFVTTIYNNVLYFCHDRSFHVKKLDYKARIYGVDLNTKKQFFFDVPFPKTSDKAITARDLWLHWITNITFSDDQLLIMGYGHLWIYDKVGENQYEYKKTKSIDNLMLSYFYNNDFYILQNDHNKGYLLFKYDLVKNKKKKVQEFIYDTPFLEQFTPNQYISIDEDYIYFSKMCNFGYYRYSLDGKLVDSMVMPIEGWRTIPNDKIAATMKLPYGSSRIAYAWNFNGDYYFMRGVFPFTSEYQWVIYSSARDSIDPYGKYNSLLTQYDKIQKKWNWQYYRMNIDDNTMMSDSIFPLSFYSNKQIMIRTYRDMFIEINLTTNVPTTGLTYGAYKEAEDKYYRDNDPVFKMRLLKLKQEKSTLNLDSLLLYDYDNQRVAAETLKAKKRLFIFNKSPQCSGCQKAILDYLNSYTIKDSALVTIVFDAFSDYLSKRQNAKGIAEYFQQPYTPLYIRAGEPKTQMMQQLYDNLAFPAVLLWNEKTQKMRLFDLDEIFTESMVIYEFRKPFMDAVDEFLRE